MEAADFAPVEVAFAQSKFLRKKSL